MRGRTTAQSSPPSPQPNGGTGDRLSARSLSNSHQVLEANFDVRRFGLPAPVELRREVDDQARADANDVHLARLHLVRFTSTAVLRVRRRIRPLELQSQPFEYEANGVDCVDLR